MSLALRSPASIPTSGLAAALGALLACVNCAAPGHKLNLKAGDRPSSMDVEGLKVTLHKLGTQAVRVPEPARISPAALADLVQEAPQPYRIGPQDVLLVTVWDHPELTLALGQYRTDNAAGTLVEEDGAMYFPYVGRLQVAGMTPTEVRSLLTGKLVRTLQNPQVDVKVLAYRSQKVYVGGEVKNPAIYTVSDVPFTLAEAINRAGGFNPTADDSRMLLTRGDRTWFLNFQALMAQGGLASKITLKAGDSLLVPNNLEAPVYMMGEVMKPGTTPLVHGQLSLAKAISDVGGISGLSADARSVYVIRRGGSADAVDVWHLDARNPTSMILADRFALQPRDIVYVDAGTSVRFSRVMNMILPTYSATVQSALTAAEIHYFSRTNK